MEPQEKETQQEQEQDPTTKYPGDKPLDETKHLWESFNYWYETTLDRLIQYRQGLAAFYNNPTKTIPTQSGQLSVFNILERRKPAVDEAIEYVQTIKAMLEAIGETVPMPQNEKLQQFLNTELPDPNMATGAVKSPYSPDEQEKGDEGKDEGENNESDKK